MKFAFENLGFVKKGEIELGDLTIVCGKNNTGKTFLTYSVYGFLKHWKKFIEISIQDSEIEALKNDGVLLIDLKTHIDKTKEYLSILSTEFSKRLDSLFNSPEEYFENTRFECIINKASFEFKEVQSGSATFGGSKGSGELIFSKNENEHSLSVVLQTKDNLKFPNRILREMISDFMGYMLFKSSFPKPFIITSERTGVSLFYTELDIHKNNMVRYMTENNDRKFDPIHFIKNMSSRYALPIHDNIDVSRDIKQVYKKKSFIKKEKNDLYKDILLNLKNLVGGNFKLVGEQVMYVPQKSKLAIPLYLASSSAKSLFLLDAYLHYIASEGEILIIDEPELNLHPDKQILMARLLVQLVNAGVKVMVSTHSDFLIREINNTIMLSSNFFKKDEFLKQEKLTPNDFLAVDKVRAYYFSEDDNIKKLKVDHFGIDVKEIDNVINQANRKFGFLYNSLLGEYANNDIEK